MFIRDNVGTGSPSLTNDAMHLSISWLLYDDDGGGAKQYPRMYLSEKIGSSFANMQRFDATAAPSEWPVKMIFPFASHKCCLIDSYMWRAAARNTFFNLKEECVFDIIFS